jgi:P27 family predicted phage terminase small subunit
MPGPPPQPTSLKILRGNPGKRRLNLSEPKPNLANGDVPAFLPAQARPIWERIAPELAATDRLAVEDQDLLGAACWLIAKGWQYAAKEDAGRTMEAGGKGPPSTSLWAAMKCLDKAANILGRFGLTPAERARLHVRDHADRDPVDAYRAKPSRRPAP